MNSLLNKKEGRENRERRKGEGRREKGGGKDEREGGSGGGDVGAMSHQYMTRGGKRTKRKIRREQKKKERSSTSWETGMESEREHYLQ